MAVSRWHGFGAVIVFITLKMQCYGTQKQSDWK